MAKTKLFLSARVTEKFFSPEEIEQIKQELQTCSKSGFIRKAIKTYLNAETKISSLPNEENPNYSDHLQKLIKLAEENQSLLLEIKNNKSETTAPSQQEVNQPHSNTYQGQEQEAKMDEALNLLDQF